MNSVQSSHSCTQTSIMKAVRPVSSVCSTYEMLLTILILCSAVQSSLAHKLISERPTACPVFLTLSTLSRNTEESNIEINWGPDCETPPHWIGLYRKDPSVSDDEPVAYVETNGKSNGRTFTNVKFGSLHLPGGWNRNDMANGIPKLDGTRCLPFYVAGYQDRQLASLNCLKIQPQWMTKQPDLWNVALKDLFIPGTHCSGCYPNRFTGRSLLVRKFGYTQNFDVWTQLVMGVRYLDISVGYQQHNGPHNETKHFWVVNDSVFVTPLTSILSDIREFVRISGEMVIMDIREFPFGFYNHPDRHLALIKLLDTELGDISYRRNDTEKTSSSNLSMNDMKAAGRMLLITYNEPRIVNESQMLWQSWRRFSTLTLRQEDVKEYMRKAFTKKYEGSSDEVGWSFIGGQGVESSYSIGQNLPTSRERAAIINKDIAAWVGGPWSLRANVVAIDFIMSTNLLDIAIYTNRNKKVDAHNLINFDVQH